MRETIPKILLIEDQEIDVKLIKSCCDRLNKPLKLYTVNSGFEALDFISNNGLVDLILLDINMPEMSGQEFLENFRKLKNHYRTVVIMFTSSENPEDIDAFYKLGINGYICKPESPAEILKSLNIIYQFWFETAKRPAKT